jgi:Na+/H+ antiporter NhaC
MLLLSLAPPILSIVLALITRQVIPSLLIGLWVGSFIVAPGIIPSIAKMADYIINTLADTGNLDVLLFLYAFSGLVAVIELSGMGAMASGIAEVEHMDYITAQMPYNLTAATVAAVGFLVAALKFRI